jgi:hypothetical protein
MQASSAREKRFPSCFLAAYSREKHVFNHWANERKTAKDPVANVRDLP